MSTRPSTHQRLFPLLAWALIALGFAARVLRSASAIFGPGGPHLIPTDSHYYLRFAQLQAGAFPKLTRFDPLVNFPEGAAILWPPIHTWTLELLLWMGPDSLAPEAVAVWLGPILFLCWATGLWFVTRHLWDAHAATWLVATLALTPLAVADGSLGNLDHHVHEAPWITLLLIFTSRVLTHPSRGSHLALAIALAAGRLLTTSGFLGAPVVATGLLLGAVLSVPGRPRASPSERDGAWRTAISVGLAAALLQMGAVGAWGAPGTVDFTQLSAFHPLWTLAWFAGAAGLGELLRGGSRLRAAAALALAVAAASPLAQGIIDGLADAARRDAVLATAVESRPLWGDPVGAASLLGIGWGFWGLALLLGSVGRDDAPPALAWRLRWGVGAGLPLLLLALPQIRFTRLGVGACAVAIAVSVPVIWPLLLQSSLRNARVALPLISALFALAPLSRPQNPFPHEERHLRESIEWLARHAPPVTNPPEWAVLSTWTYGHLLTSWGGLPVLATPFSQAEVHERGNARALEILTETDDQQAFQRARAERVRYVLAAPYHGTVGPPEEEGRTLMANLLEHAGMGAQREGSSHFRLLYTSQASRNREAGGPLARIFEVVEGARLTGTAAPHTAYAIQLVLKTTRGEQLNWERRIRTDAQGTFEVRAPYPTENVPGTEVRAVGPYRLIGPRGLVGVFHLSAEDVEQGGQRTLRPVLATP